jgi:uncharacterized protein YdaL
MKRWTRGHAILGGAVALLMITGCGPNEPSLSVAAQGVTERENNHRRHQEDGGSTRSDAGTDAADAGTGAADAGTGAADAGTGAADAGTGAADAGTGAADAGTGAADAGTGSPDGGATGSSDGGTTTTSTLILFDTTGEWGFLGELYAINVANLTTHFGTFTAKPVSSYAAGEISQHTATIYVGSTYNEPLPDAFLSDVLASTRPVIWMYDNIWQLTAKSPTFQNDNGWTWFEFDTSSVSRVIYKGQTLTRYAANLAGIMSYAPGIDTTKATILASAVHDSDGTTFPWAIRSGYLTYIGELPFAFTSDNDRWLIFADLLFDVLAPTTKTTHLALVRIEDVNPASNPTQLRAIADYLGSIGVPFSIAAFPLYLDPLAAENPSPTTIHMVDAPDVASALRYMISKGGTLVMHGYTHQYDSTPNALDGESGDDFEFFRAHLDNTLLQVVLDGPLPIDSFAWALGRVQSSMSEFNAAGLPIPTIFEFPHYAGSATDYAAVQSLLPVRYDRALYFAGQLTGGPVSTSVWVGQSFPYAVRDLHEALVIPENLGAYSPDGFLGYPPRPVSAILDAARANLVVRGGFASFFYHPYYGVSPLQQIVEGVLAMGYSFVPVGSVTGP